MACLQVGRISHLRAVSRVSAGVIAAVMLVGVIGCKEKEEGIILTPVTGTLLIDGQAHERVAVRCRAAGGDTSTIKNISQGFTDKEGKFSLSTNIQGDGLPVGEYVLLVQWGKLLGISMKYDGDKLNGKYNDPKTPAKTFTVKAGVPVDLGTIDLKSS